MPEYELVPIRDEIRELKAWTASLTDLNVDIENIYNASLSYAENQRKIREEIDRIEKVSFAEQLVKDYNAEDRQVTNEVIDEYYKSIRRSIDKLVQGYSNLVFVRGSGGFGKSWSIERYLKESGAIPIPPEYMNRESMNEPVINKLKGDKAYYLEITGELSEAYLYRILYVFNGCVLWFRDVNKLLKKLRSIDILKSATESTGKRLICNNNYSHTTKDIPRQFIYFGSVIFDFNSLQGISLKEDFEALQTRGDYIEVSLSQDDMAKIMRSIAKTDWQKETTEFLINKHSNSGFNLMNLRTQWKAFRTYEYSIANKKDWKQEVIGELNNTMSPVRAMLYQLIGRKPIKAMELKKLLLKRGEVNSLRTAHRKVSEWIAIEEIYRVSNDDKNFYICIDYMTPSKVKEILKR